MIPGTEPAATLSISNNTTVFQAHSYLLLQPLLPVHIVRRRKLLIWPYLNSDMKLPAAMKLPLISVSVIAYSILSAAWICHHGLVYLFTLS